MLDNNLIAELRKKLVVMNDPFPHISASNILPVDIAKRAESEFFTFDKFINSGAYKYGNLHRNFPTLDEMPTTVKEIITFFYSNNFLNFLGEKFNLKNIIPDWRLWGGGMHSSPRGGHVTIHSDFIYQRNSNPR